MDLDSNTYNCNEFVTHSLQELSHPYPLLNSIIVPRPIAFITTIGESGIINAAPFSYFSVVSSQPTILSVSIERRQGQRKDTARNILVNKEFVINICSADMAKAVSHAGKDFPPHVSEIELTGLSLIPSKGISPPRIANAPIQIECTLKKSFEIEENQGDLILGYVIHVHINKQILDDNGYVDFEKLNPLARLSGRTFARLSDLFDV